MTPGGLRAAGRRIAAAAALFAAVLGASPAQAQPEPSPLESELRVDATPVLSQGGLLLEGWNEFVVRVQNVGQNPHRGQLRLTAMAPHTEGAFEVTAPYAVAPGSGVSVRMPAQIGAFADVVIEVVEDGGAEPIVRRFPHGAASQLFLVDVHEPSHLRSAIHETAIFPTYTPSPLPGRMSPGGGSGPPQLALGSPAVDSATGDPILPAHAAGYGTATAVLLHAEALGRLGVPEQQALAGYVIAGGTLAIVIGRPEDLRLPSVTALAGGELARARVSQTTLKRLPYLGTTTGGVKQVPDAQNATDAVSPTLTGFTGGNLVDSAYGSSAPYGLGEVHLLAFDPTSRPAVDDPWVQARVVDLVRRAHDRKATVVYPHGGPALDERRLATVKFTGPAITA
jgi:hypothetical protein